MQKINVRRAEKLDFLEEHSRTLVAELQKKTKIIQNYILHENFDAMGSNERDRHKVSTWFYKILLSKKKFTANSTTRYFHAST